MHVILSEYIDLLAYDTAFWMTALYNPDYPVDDLGGLCLDLSAKLRCLAISALLVNADSDTFHHNLIRSGIGRIRYLRRCRDEGGETDHHCVSGRYGPFLDLVTAGDFDRAKELADLTPSSFQPPREDEDDFCYAQILQRMVGHGATEVELRPLLERFEQSVGNESSMRLELCRALTVGDQEQFDESFAGLLSERRRSIETKRRGGQVEEPGIVAERYVCVEALAILRIADLRGLATESEYLFCPSIARRAMLTPFPGE